MNMYEELKAWADKWGVEYREVHASEMSPNAGLVFNSLSYYPAVFEYHKTFAWYGGN